jgi:hypothetical protein
MAYAQNLVTIQHRPRRVAFFLDMDQSSDKLFNGIVEFNVTTWGGRFNPIIPVMDGQVTEPYWNLLRLVNPDIIYTYCPLDDRTVRRIAAEVRPLDVIKHLFRGEEPHDVIRVQIDLQASIAPVLSRIVGQFPVWMPQAQPTALVFDHKDVSALNSFVRRNFGCNGHYSFICRDLQIASATVPPDEKDVMRAVAGNSYLILPINVCADAPRKLKGETADQGIALTLCYGDSPWNFIEYWNLAHFVGEIRQATRGLSEMWITPSSLDDTDFYKAFIGLLQRRVSTSGNGQYLRLVSYDETQDRMTEVTKRICADFKWNMYPAPPLSLRKGELPVFKPRGIISLYAPEASRPRSKQVAGSSSFLELSPGIDGPNRNEERSIAEFAVENSIQERYFANKTAWWKLPKKEGVPRLFVPSSPCRVGNDHLISVEVSGVQQGVMLTTPDLNALFASLILPKLPWWFQKFDSTRRAEDSFYIRASDKGMYARGVLGLFESLQKATYVFEHRFWRGVLELLSSPVVSEQTRNKVRKNLEKIGIEALASSSGIDLIVDEVLDAASHIQRPTHYINFGKLFTRYWTFIQTQSRDEQLREVSEIDSRRSEASDEKGIENAARGNLRDMLSELTARKVFLQGAEIRCIHCLARLWYHVADLQARVTCRGCRKELDLPAEISWSYALNELVVSAVRDHGVVPVIRTAYRLFEDSRECFCFLPGIEIRDYDTEGQVCELDLVWIRDGEFGAAEVKRTPKKFKVGKGLKKVLGGSLPDRFLVVSSSGTDQEMQMIRDQFQTELDSEINVEAWNPETFARSSHIGWNTFIHSLLG